MHRLFEEYLSQLEELHGEIQNAITGLPPEALDWSPGVEMNSINVLVAHCAGSERYWISDVAGQTATRRDREAEFRTRGLEQAEIQRRLDEALTTARAIVNTINLPDLEQEVATRGGERTVSIAWALLHALEHVALHTGHIQLTAQLWRQRE